MLCAQNVGKKIYWINDIKIAFFFIVQYKLHHLGAHQYKSIAHQHKSMIISSTRFSAIKKHLSKTFFTFGLNNI